MGYTTSSIHGIEVPNSAEANDVPEDIGKVVTALEGGSFARRLTGAQIAALTGAQKTAGVLVYNTTTNRLQISDGTNFADYVAGTPTYAIGALSSNQTIAASGSDVTVAFSDSSDPSGIHASGVFTLPSAGVWQVSGAAVFATGFSFTNTIALKHNSTRIITCKPWYTKVSPAQGSPTAEFSILINAAASDTVRMVADNSNGLSGIDLLATVTRMTVVKIGA